MKNILCALSGGVDSTVSAYLLQSKGFKVTGIFIKNWDTYDELGHCSGENDLRNCQKVCHHLNIDLLVHDNIKSYWNDVFMHTLKSYELGYTPNPDILCNRFVKFSILDQYVRATREFDAFATGHYAQNSHGNFLQNKSYSSPKLLRSVDKVKDQSFWLSTIKSKYLENAMFPVGGMMKRHVKRIAAEIGLESIAKQKESMGMCFIGKRNFNLFIDEYIEKREGEIIYEDNGQVLGHHEGIHHFTYGQRVPIFNRQGPFYVSKFDVKRQIVYLVKETNNPKLFMKSCTTYPSVWLSDIPPSMPRKLHFQWQNKWKPIDAIVRGESCGQNNYPFDYREDDRNLGPSLNISLDQPMRCIAPGQWAALYEDNICLGGAQIHSSTRITDQGWPLDKKVDWKPKDFEIFYED